VWYIRALTYPTLTRNLLGNLDPVAVQSNAWWSLAQRPVAKRGNCSWASPWDDGRKVSEIVCFDFSGGWKTTMTRFAVMAAAVFLVCAVHVRADEAPQRGRDSEAQKSTGTDKPSAREIISRMEETYRTCRSYSDTGLVKTVFISEHGNRIEKKPFTTAFVRSDRFRFEYRSKHPFPGAKELRHIIWSDGDEVRTWWDVRPGVKKEPSLLMAVAAATGVSGASAKTIPTLLMPDKLGASRITMLDQPKRLAESTIDGVACYRVRGKLAYSDSPPITLWISKASFLIHRIDETALFAATEDRHAFRTELTTTYKPNVGIELTEEDLAFNAPDS